MKHTLAFISVLIALLVMLPGCHSTKETNTENETKHNEPAAVESDSGDETTSTATVESNSGDESTSAAPVEIPTEQAKCVTEEDGTYYITLPISGQKVKFMYGYERCVPYITDELVEKAEKTLSNEMLQYDEIASDFYLRLDMQDYLCLSFEVIVDFDSYNPNSPEGDHEHRFYDERITVCPLPSKNGQ